MNKENAKKYLPVLQALADGKQLEYRNGFGEWGVTDNIYYPYFEIDPTCYRIKPEPRIWSFWLDPEGDLHPYNTTPFTDWKRITVQEVLE